MKKSVVTISLVFLLSLVSLAQVRAKVQTKPVRRTVSTRTATTTTSQTTHTVSLSWQESVTGVTFNIYRGVTAGGEALLTTGVNTLAFTDSAVTNGQTYFYYVTAVGTGGESGPSNEVSVQIPSPPPAPTALTGVVQ